MALTHDDVRQILAIIDRSAPAEIEVQTDGFSLHVVIGEEAPAPAPAPAGVGTAQHVEGVETIDSPVLGTFYRAESPGAAPFVEVGSAVEPDTVVCIIEVMKMMNSITAGMSGTIVEVVPENGGLVEFGEALFRVEPA
jgi:acetyl-CoA carboxylase biotin carboxyl carrier protein